MKNLWEILYYINLSTIGYNSSWITKKYATKHKINSICFERDDIQAHTHNTIVHIV